jgi:hypothetical protein
VRTPKAVLEQRSSSCSSSSGRTRPTGSCCAPTSSTPGGRRRPRARDQRRRTPARHELEQKRARLDDAFIYRQAIDEGTYRAQRDELREATLQHASRLWTAETCTARRIQLQWALLPAGIRCRENGVIEPPVTYSDFFQLQPLTGMKKRLVDHPAPSWNRRSLDWLTTLYQWKAA